MAQNLFTVLVNKSFSSLAKGMTTQITKDVSKGPPTKMEIAEALSKRYGKKITDNMWGSMNSPGSIVDVKKE